MENFKPIEYHQMRDFSRKMNTTFEFIRQNFKSLGKSILLIAGPPVLIASIIMATFMDAFLGLTRSAAMNPGDTETIETYFMSVNFWLQVVLMFLLFLVSSIMSIATINNYLILYEEKQSNEIEPSEVWRRVRETFWMYFGTTLIFFLLFVALCIVMVIPFGLIAAISPVLIFLAMISAYGVIIYLFISASLTYFVRAYERKGFFDSIVRSFKLVQNKWWSTFGIIFILYLVMMVVSYILMIPWSVMSWTTALHDISSDPSPEPSSSWLSIGFLTLAYLAQMVLGALPNIGIAFQYFNLVEMKEAKGLLGKIDTLGQSQQSSSSEEQY